MRSNRLLHNFLSTKVQQSKQSIIFHCWFSYALSCTGYFDPVFLILLFQLLEYKRFTKRIRWKMVWTVVEDAKDASKRDAISETGNSFDQLPTGRAFFTLLLFGELCLRLNINHDETKTIVSWKLLFQYVSNAFSIFTALRVVVEDKSKQTWFDCCSNYAVKNFVVISIIVRWISIIAVIVIYIYKYK